jgi:hypothetical protein
VLELLESCVMVIFGPSGGLGDIWAYFLSPFLDFFYFALFGHLVFWGWWLSYNPMMP